MVGSLRGEGSCAGGGIRITANNAQEVAVAQRRFHHQLVALGYSRYVEEFCEESEGRSAVRFCLCADSTSTWAPGYDTLRLRRKIDLDTGGDARELEREILLALLLSPQVFDFPSYDEFAAAMRIRRRIAKAAARTALAFDTRAAERPADCWRYSEENGFTLLPGKPLVTALLKATQPDVSGKRYAFSCYRATEYVILLAMAQEAMTCNHTLYRRLQEQWERRAIMSGRFHDTFLREYGSMETPLPAKYYVPGDRLWFRNPDEHSSNVSGYEGSWVFYLGDGLFANFWKRDQPYTLDSKCVEVYHWRHATYLDADGELQIDENVVEARVRETMADPAEKARIIELMLRYREPRGVYAAGGCIDTTREYPRWICPGTTDVVL